MEIEMTRERYDVIVLGAGPGGYVAAIRAAQLGLSVAVVDKRPYGGGACLHEGCIPTKTLLHLSEKYFSIKNMGKSSGIELGAVRCNFKTFMEKRNDTVEALTQGVMGLFKKNKVAYIQGTGTLISAEHIDVVDEEGGKKTYTASSIILATGSEPIPLPSLGFDGKNILSSTDILSLEELPSKILVVGGGYIGVEIGAMYSCLGVDVTIIEFMERLCPDLDEEMSAALLTMLEQQGVTVKLHTELTRGKVSDGQASVILSDRKNKQTALVKMDTVLVSIGRRPVTKKCGLEKIGVALDDKGFIIVDDSFRTNIPSVYAIGDCIGGMQLAHKASEEGSAVAEILAGGHPHIDYIAIPSVVYTSPEVATVGLTVKMAKEYNVPVYEEKFLLKNNPRARCVGETEGFIKMVVEESSRRIVGVHIVGENASEMIHCGVMALHMELTVDDMATVCFAHPTLSEAFKEVAMRGAHGVSIHT
jgi:dihydrolipoamide dehydrogenase